MSYRRPICAAISLSIAFGLMPLRLDAASCNGIEFPPDLPVDGQSLVLNGMGLREATMLNLDVYVAGLYLPDRETRADAILDANPIWQVDMEFLRHVDAEDIREAWNEGLENNGAEMKAMADSIGALDALVRDLNAGDRLSFSHVLGKGLRVGMNDRDTLIPGDDFARAMLAIWLGPNPPDADLRQGLLGASCS